MNSSKINFPIFGLVDCNNFFVSCERVFQPRLENRPVVVLSSNDGCVISRSNEAKALKIKMGVPVFQIKELIKQHNVVVLSSNFTLYGDMSWRVMETLSKLVPAFQIYSIDEVFLDLTGFSDVALNALGKKITQTVYQCTGIPVSLGIGSTKTLAKVANHVAKKNKKYDGVFDIHYMNTQARDDILSQFQLQDIWGVGINWAYKLNQLGIVNAGQLSKQNPLVFRKRFNSILAGTILELQGIPVQDLEEELQPRKQIMVSRSFGKIVTEFQELEQALATHITRALEKLRDQGSVAKAISIFLQTSRFCSDEPYHHQKTIELSAPSQDTRVFLKVASRVLKSLFCKNLNYKKAGIVLLEISSKRLCQLDLFTEREEKSEPLMTLLDQINITLGQGTVRFAVEGYQKGWGTHSLHRTPRYTTCWSELPIAR